MALPITDSNPLGDASSVLAAHAHRLAHGIGGHDEEALIDLVRHNTSAIRVLQGVNSTLASLLDEQGGLSSEDVFATVGKQSGSEARRVRLRAALGTELPSTAGAFEAGRVPTENIDAVSSARRRLRHNAQWLAAFDSRDVTIARRAAQQPPRRFAMWLRALTDRLSDDGETEQRTNESQNAFRSWTDANGRWQARLDLDAITGEMMQTAIDAEARSLAKQQDPLDSPNHHGEGLNAEALVGLVQSGNGAKGRPSINVVCDLETLRSGEWEGTTKHTGAGNGLPLSSLRRYLCDAWITHTVLGPSGRALAVGRSYRTATDAQRAALRVMYSTCAMCDVGFDHCEMHHIIEWENGGPTDLSNLIPLCGHHHEQVHHRGYRLELSPERSLTVNHPDGAVWKQIPLPSERAVRHRTTSGKEPSDERTPGTTE